MAQLQAVMDRLQQLEAEATSARAERQTLIDRAVQAEQRLVAVSAESTAAVTAATAAQAAATSSTAPAPSVTGAGLIDTRSIGKPRDFNGSPQDWQEWQFIFKAYATTVESRMKQLMDKAAASGSTVSINSVMNPVEQRLSAQLFYRLVLLSKDRALSLIRNCPRTTEQRCGADSSGSLSRASECATRLSCRASLGGS